MNLTKTQIFIIPKHNQFSTDNSLGQIGDSLKNIFNSKKRRALKIQIGINVNNNFNLLSELEEHLIYKYFHKFSEKRANLLYIQTIFSICHNKDDELILVNNEINNQFYIADNFSSIKVNIPDCYNEFVIIVTDITDCISLGFAPVGTAGRLSRLCAGRYRRTAVSAAAAPLARLPLKARAR
jgi:hypothetical protein